MDDRAQSVRRPARNRDSRLALILLIGGLALIIAAVLVVPRFFDRSSTSQDQPTQTGAVADWARAYIYNGATGEGVAIDPDGSVVERFGSMGTFIDSRVVARSRSVAFLGETIEIGPIPKDGTSANQYSLPVPQDGLVAVLGVPDRLVLAIHQEGGGNIVIVDADARRSLDVAQLLGSADPSFTLEQLQLEPSGEQFAIYDQQTNETAVISFSRPQPRYFKNRPLAISSDRLFTTHTDGLDTIATLYSLDGSIIDTFNTSALVSATMDGHTVYLITEENDILRLDDGASTPVRLTRVPDADRVALAHNGDRLVVDSPWGFAILDQTGKELGQLRPGSGGVENPSRTSLCLATDVNELVARDRPSNAVGRGPAVLDLGTLTLTPVTRLPIHSSTPDGCSVATQIAETPKFQLVSIGNRLQLDAAGAIPIVGDYSRMFMSPNPNQWIAMLPDKSVRLFELVDGKATELATIPFPEADYITVAYIPVATDDS